MMKMIDKDQWDELYARPDTNWYEGMTQYQAEVIRDEYDYNLKHQIMNNTDAFNFANTAGYFAGALFDPLNFCPGPVHYQAFELDKTWKPIVESLKIGKTLLKLMMLLTQLQDQLQVNPLFT